MAWGVAARPAAEGTRGACVGHGRGWRLRLLLLTAASGALVQPLRADDPAVCHRVARIVVVSHGLFAPEDLVGRRLGWGLGLVDRLHVGTRHDLARGLLRIAEGDCYDTARVDDSVRRLRDLPFVARAEATAQQRPDSTWVVHVRLWDEWSTEVSPEFDVENRFRYKGGLLSERNLLGRGLGASVRWRDFREDRVRLVALSSTRFLGTQAFARGTLGVTRVGRYWRQEVTRPWLDEGPGASGSMSAQAEQRPFAYLTGMGSGPTHVVLPLDDRNWLARAQRRTGQAGALRLVGAELEVIRRTLTGAPRLVLNRDFTTGLPVSDAVVRELASHASPDSWLRLGLTAGWRRIRFSAAPGLDLMSGAQTIAEGTELMVTVGRTVTTWQTTPVGSYVKLEGYATRMMGPLLLQGLVAGRGVRFDRKSAEGTVWRELGVSGRAIGYLRLPPTALHRVVAGVRTDLRTRNDQPFQRTLGGEEGVRGYTNEELPAGSTLTLFAEDRLDLPWFRPAADVGLTGFVDVGRGWRSGTPFGMETGWRMAVGGGFRFAFPAGSGTVYRVEMAWPVNDAPFRRGPVFRTYWSPVLTLR